MGTIRILAAASLAPLLLAAGCTLQQASDSPGPDPCRTAESRFLPGIEAVIDETFADVPHETYEVSGCEERGTPDPATEVKTDWTKRARAVRHLEHLGWSRSGRFWLNPDETHLASIWTYQMDESRQIAVRIFPVGQHS